LCARQRPTWERFMHVDERARARARERERERERKRGGEKRERVCVRAREGENRRESRQGETEPEFDVRVFVSTWVATHTFERQNQSLM
jgi:hypothetical protein